MHRRTVIATYTRSSETRSFYMESYDPTSEAPSLPQAPAAAKEPRIRGARRWLRALFALALDAVRELFR
ncbi:hypothetical protein [Rhizomonospora bruguierae]|uniref:hypothetical protein n=1 Tax=Rhizomonospora bruguierae TaxID=1581705 RepID=UPI001BCCE138|nr:hypothetical protein [Micromonospora sp. NBRC 107566]